MSKEFVMFYIICGLQGTKKLNFSQKLCFFVEFLDFGDNIYYDITVNKQKVRCLIWDLLILKRC